MEREESGAVQQRDFFRNGENCPGKTEYGGERPGFEKLPARIDE